MRRLKRPAARESHSPFYTDSPAINAVWVRGMAPDAGSDSLHVGLNGQTPASAANLTRFDNEWSWSRATTAGDASVSLSGAGGYTLDLWMLETASMDQSTGQGVFTRRFSEFTAR
jgi:hypothetical protein